MSSPTKRNREDGESQEEKSECDKRNREDDECRLCGCDGTFCEEHAQHNDGQNFCTRCCDFCTFGVCRNTQDGFHLCEGDQNDTGYCCDCLCCSKCEDNGCFFLDKDGKPVSTCTAESEKSEKSDGENNE